MKPKTAVFIIAIFGILVVVAAYVKRGEFGIGPEWALPVIAAAIIIGMDRIIMFITKYCRELFKCVCQVRS